MCIAISLNILEKGNKNVQYVIKYQNGSIVSASIPDINP